jgi:hypothetical protein
MSDDGLVREVLAEIDRLSPVELAAELVRIPSHPGIERQEERVALALGRFFGERDLGVQLEEIAPGRPNAAPADTCCSAATPTPCRSTRAIPVSGSPARCATAAWWGAARWT